MTQPQLHISNSLALPLDAVTQKIAVLGMTGSGKSYCMTKLAELFLDARAQVVILDPKGEAWGLRLKADGKTPAYSIPVFGGDHGDIPLQPDMGASIADLLVDGDYSAVLDVSEFVSSELARFGYDFVSKSNIAVFSDQSPTSSGYANNLGRLRALGLIAYPAGGTVALTSAGLERSNGSLDIATLDELHRAWFSKLALPRVNILNELIRIHPRDIQREHLAEAVGQSATSSGYANNLGALRSLGLIDYPRQGYVAATELLFPEGLM